MTVAETILKQLRDLGATVKVSGAHIAISPEGVLTPALRKLVGQYKPEIMRHLTAPSHAHEELVTEAAVTFAASTLVDENVFAAFRRIAQKHFPKASTDERIFAAARALCDVINRAIHSGEHIIEARARYCMRRLEEQNDAWRRSLGQQEAA